MFPGSKTATPSGFSNTVEPDLVPESPASEWIMAPQSTTQHTAPTVKDLRNTHSLWYRIHVLIYDLRHPERDSDAAGSQWCRIYLGFPLDAFSLPYFTKEEADLLKAVKVDGGARTLTEAMYEAYQKRWKMGRRQRHQRGGFGVFTRYDLAKVLEAAFGIEYKHHTGNPAFVRRMKISGVDLKEGQVCPGLSTGPKKPKKKVPAPVPATIGTAS